MGALSPRYSFGLNPYREFRFTTCPACKTKTRLRKLPLAIHSEGVGLFVLRKTCRMCVACDMVIVQPSRRRDAIDVSERGWLID